MGCLQILFGKGEDKEEWCEFRVLKGGVFAAPKNCSGLLVRLPHSENVTSVV